MTMDSQALARCLYEQFGQAYMGARWSELALLETRLWEAKAEGLITKLDQHGYRLSYIPPEA